MQRRHVLASTVGIAATIAGCGDDPEEIEGGSRDETDTPTATDSEPQNGDEELEEQTDTPTEEETDTPESEPNLELASHEMQTVEHEYWTDVYVEAIVENSGDAASGNIEVQADWYDEDGNYLDNDTAYLTTLQAGETWECRVYYLGSDAEEVADYEVGGEFYARSGEINPEGLELLESEMSVRENDDDVEVRGRVRNTSGSDQDYVEAIATIYDDDKGVVMGDEFTNVTDFREGETWRFSMTWFGRDRTSRATSHQVYLGDSI